MKLFRSIRSKIIIQMLLVSIVPIFIIAALVFMNMYSTKESVGQGVKDSSTQLQHGLEKGRAAIEQNTIELNLINMSELMLSQLSLYLIERVQDIYDWSTDPRVINALKTGENQEGSAFIKRNVARNPMIEHISICDLEGKTIIKTSSATSPIQHYHEWWQTATNGSIYIGNPLQSETLNGFTVQVGIPVIDIDNIELIGALEANFVISSDQIANAWGGRIPGSSVLFIDGKYNLIADSADPDRSGLGYTNWSKAEQMALDRLQFENEKNGYVVIEDDEVIVFSRWLVDENSTNYFNVSESPDIGWAIMMKMPASVAFAPFEAFDADNILEGMTELEDTVERDTSQILLSLIVVLTLVGLLVFVMAVWLSRGLTSPIIKLHDGVIEVMGGNLLHRVGSEANDEIGHLSRAFDEMTIAVSRAQAELRNYGTNLEKMVNTRTNDLQKEIVERRRAEEGLMKAHEQLQGAHDELKTSQEQLLQSAKMAAVGQLVSGVAHEVNNPLMAILGNSEMLLKKTEEERSRKRLQRIFTETNRAIVIVRNLLSFARKQESEKEPMPINESIESVIQLRSYDMSLHDIEIEMELASDLPDVMADSQQLQQVFLNLLINAEQAIKRNGDSGKVVIQTRKYGKKIIVTFADDGPGIPEDILDRIFEPFFTTKDVGEGTGLGLSICYGIINDHKGKITVKSREGQGSTFTLEFPVASE